LSQFHPASHKVAPAYDTFIVKTLLVFLCTHGDTSGKNERSEIGTGIAYVRWR